MISTLKEEDIVVSLGTIGPGAIIGLERSLRPEDVHMLDAPMGKSSKEAGEGTLSLMVSGAEEIFHSVQPLLDRIASDITFSRLVAMDPTLSTSRPWKR